jgi:hypothetical protein
MPSIITTQPCAGFVDDLLGSAVKVGQDWLAQRQAIEAARAQNKITQQQAEMELARITAQAEADKALAEADFKKKLPLYVGGGILAIAAIYFLSRRR